MSELIGIYATLDRRVGLGGLSTDIDGQTGIPNLDCARHPGALAGARSGSGVVSAASWSMDGTREEMFDALLFERILVLPRHYDVGSVLSEKNWGIEVWNSHGAEARPLTAILIDGVGGLEILGPSGIDYFPGQSEYYTARLIRVGDPLIDTTATWLFSGESGADHRVTGQRLVLWSFEPDWADLPGEALEWKTDVLRSYAGHEQRIELRRKPRRRVAYTFTFEDARQGARAQAQVWGWQAQAFGVPIWQDHQVLVVDLPAGSVLIPIDTTLRDFAVGEQVALWSSHLEWEAVEVDAMTESSLTLKRPTLKAWPRGARVLPLRLGRMPKALDFGRASTTLAEVRVEWSLEPATGVSTNRVNPSGFPLYQGYDVLTEEPDWNPDLGEQAERDFESVDAEVGPVVVDAHTSAPEYSRPFHWVLEGRAAIARFLGFLETRKGRCVPFWLPTYAQDLEQTQDAGATDTAILVRDIQYSLYYAQHLNRRDLAFFPVTGETPVLRRIMDSAPAGADLERITLDQAFGSVKTPADWRCISFLSFVRLDQDTVQFDWETDELVRVSFRVKEVLL